MNIFEQASRQKLTFESIRGAIVVSDLWDMPLSSKSGFCLDSIARTVNTDLKSVSEESFVEVRTNPAKAQLELKLEIVKYVIADRLQANAAKEIAGGQAVERTRLIGLLEKKKDAALEGLSAEELQTRIAALSV